MAIIAGNLSPPPGRFALVAARFNSAVVENLVSGALDALKRHGVADDAVDMVRVPGSFEIPLGRSPAGGQQEIRGRDLPRRRHSRRHRPL